MSLTELQKIGAGTIKFAAGEREWIASPLTLSDLVEFEGEVAPLGIYEDDPSLRLSAMRMFLWLSLRHKHEALTLVQAGDLVTVSDLDKGGPLDKLLENFFPPRPKAEAPEEGAG